MECSNGYDSDGCPYPTSCFAVPRDKVQSSRQWNDSCLPSCPVNCPPYHLTCPGGINFDGCPMPDGCVPSYENMPRNADRQSDCPTMCPTVCGQWEVSCPSPAAGRNNGCPMPDICVPIPADMRDSERSARQWQQWICDQDMGMKN